MKKFLIVSLFALAGACSAADAPATDWTVSSTTASGKLQFTILPETVAVNSKKTLWRANVVLRDGEDTYTAYVAVTGCRELHGETTLLNPDGTPMDAKNIVSWTHKDTTVAGKLAVLVCAAAYKVNLVSAENKGTGKRVVASYDV